MAGRGAPTFLKRQKELKRTAKAQAKREAKQARRESRTDAAANPDEAAEDGMFQEPAEGDAAADETPKTESD